MGSSLTGRSMGDCAAGSERFGFDRVADLCPTIGITEMSSNGFGAIADRQDDIADSPSDQTIDHVFQERASRHWRHHLGQIRNDLPKAGP